eukprot:symbB.v1.2.039307.t1/scaffold6474.1/size21299/2
MRTRCCNSLGAVYDATAVEEFFGAKPFAVLGRLLKVLTGVSKCALLAFNGEDPESQRCLARRVREVFTELGPTYIKLGQALSVRPDVLNEAFLHEFREFQDSVTPFDNEEAVQLVLGELKISQLSDVFQDFSAKPVAAASLGQVYKARLKNGKAVAVKVQRPNLAEKVALDLVLARQVAKCLVYFADILPEGVQGNDFVGFVDAFGQRLFEELDYDFWMATSRGKGSEHGRFEVTSRRVLTAWMDLFHHDIPEVTTVEFFALLTPAVRQQINDIQDPEEARRQLIEIREQQINVLRNAHRQQFPLTDNLMSLVFLVQADLNENQRERFVTSMSLRQIDMAQYTYLQVKQLFMELFCTTRTGIADPTIRHVKRSTFLVIEEGEYDGETGYWVAEEETGDEGLVSLYIEDEFWVLSAKGGYNKRRNFSRRFKQGKGKGKGSQRKRPGFRPRSQKKGKGYLADDQVPDDQAFYGKKGKKGGKKGGKKQKDSFKSSKKGKNSKGDSSSSSGKANMANSSPSEEHVDAMESTAAGQDAWSEDYYWDSNYGCWVYFEQWDNQHESWNYFVHDGWDVRTGQQCNGVSTDFSIIGIMQCTIFLLEMFLHCSILLIGYANFAL